MKIKTTVTVTELTRDDIADILSCEHGGFDYWAELLPGGTQYRDAKEELESEADADPDRICWEDVLAQIILHHDGLIVYDREEDKRHLLTRNKLAFGIECRIAEGRADPDDWDAADADCIMQYAIFGEVIYG